METTVGRGMNHVGFHEYRRTGEIAAVYYRRGQPTANSGRQLLCAACGQWRSAVGSRGRLCKTCHQDRWRANKGLPPLQEEVYGNSFRSGRGAPPKAYRRCQVCRVIKQLDQYTVPTRFTCPRPVAVSTCRECRVSKRTLPLIRGDVAFLKDFLPPECGVCGAPVHGRSAHINHCRVTGVIRGKLCGRCNLALGLLRDREDLIAGLLRYVRADD